MKHLFFTLLLSLLMMCRASAQTVLSLDSCVALALANNKSIQSARLQVEQYQHTRKAYWANYFPNFSAQIADVYSNAEGELGFDLAAPAGAFLGQLVGKLHPAILQSPEGQALLQGMASEAKKLNPTIDYKVGNVFMAFVNVQQPIYMGGKISAAYRMAKLGQQMAERGVVLGHDEVVVKTTEAYALLVKASVLQHVAVRYDSLLQKLLLDVENAHKHGMVGPNDVLKVQVKKNEAELQMRQAENGIKLARMNLCQSIGLPLVTAIEVEDVQHFLTATASPADHDASVTSRPEYTYLDMKSQLAAEQVRIERSAFLPQVGVGASFGYVNGVEVLDKRLMGDEPSFSVMATVKIPIYHANEAQHKVKAARLAYERTQLEQNELVEKMNLELQQAINNLDEGLLEAELADRNFKQADENLRESRRSYDVGLESLSDLLTAQTLWQQAYAQQAIAHSQLMVLSAKYKKASGRL